MTSRRLLRTAVSVGSLGLISVVYSEALFWSRWRSDDSAGGYLVTWLAYTLVTLLVLMLVERFRLRGVLGIALAGAVFGWLVEGAVAVTLYADIPWSISWTALAWHGLITVIGGWLLVPRALATWPIRRLFRWAIFVGAAWGIWAVTWRVEDGAWTSVGAFALFALSAAVLLAGGYLVWQRTYRPVTPYRWAILAVAAPLAVSAAIQVRAIAVVLPILVGGVVTAMAAGRGKFEGPEIVPKEPIRLIALTIPLVVAATAIAVFAALQTANVVSNTAALFYLFTMPAGFIIVILAVFSVLKGMGTAEES